MLSYAVAFKILMIGNMVVEAINEAGGELGSKKKNDDTVGRILKELSNLLLYKSINHFVT